jgi:hypothetical protein
MGITFGIITDGSNDNQLKVCLNSILSRDIPEIEVIVVGNTKLQIKGVKRIKFDEAVKQGWITKKKNLIALAAKNDILVLMHDYFILDQGWDVYSLESITSSKWDVGMCNIYNLNGERFRDWCLWPFDHWILRSLFTWKKDCLLPYSEKGLSNFMYISGGFFLVKKQFLISNPFNEAKSWGEGEDIEWSVRLREKWNYKSFDYLSIKSLKLKASPFTEISKWKLKVIKLYSFVYLYTPVKFRVFFKTAIFHSSIKKRFRLKLS